MKNNFKKILKKLIIPLVIFFLFFSQYKAKATDINSLYLYDEYAWIGRGFYFELLLKNDFENDLWKTHKIDGDPKLASYLYGMSIFPSYRRNKINKDKDYDMVRYLIDKNLYARGFLNKTAQLKYNKFIDKEFINWHPKDANGQTLEYLLNKYGKNFQETVNLIIEARMGAVFFLSLSAVLTYWLGILVFNNIFIAILASLSYGFSSLVVTYGVVAYSESLYLFLTNFCLIILTLLFSGKTTLRWFKLIIFAITAALLNQTKLNGLLMICFYTLLNGIYFIKDFKKALIEFFLVINIFFLFYILTNPFLFGNPVQNIIFQYQWTRKVTESQLKGGWSSDSLPDIGSRLNYIGKYLFKNTSHDQLSLLIKDNNIKTAFIKLLNTLFSLGLVLTMLQLKKNLKSAKSIFLIISLLSFISMLFYLSLAWERYLINLILPIFLITGQGILYSIDFIKYLKLKFKK